MSGKQVWSIDPESASDPHLVNAPAFSAFPLLLLALNALSLDSDPTSPTLSMLPRPDGDVCLVEILAES